VDRNYSKGAKETSKILNACFPKEETIGGKKYNSYNDKYNLIYRSNKAIRLFSVWCWVSFHNFHVLKYYLSLQIYKIELN
jgi:hypothetical protein